MNKEKVHELAIELYKCSVSVENNERLITEWLEQNQPEPVVKWGIDAKVDFMDMLECAFDSAEESSGIKIDNANRSGVESHFNHYRPWKEVEPVVVGLNHTQLEELCDRLSEFVERHIVLNAYYRMCDENIFTKPEAKEVSVGLSEEQVKDLVFYFSHNMHTHPIDTEQALESWLKTQTSAQSESSFINRGDYKELYNELEQLKSQQFQPSWDDAPSWANWLAQDSDGRWQWFRNKPKAKSKTFQTDSSLQIYYGGVKNWKQTLQERPKPTPQVEVGQVWVNGGYVDDILQSVNIDYASDQVVVFSGHYTNDKQQCLAIPDFLAKFERVS